MRKVLLTIFLMFSISSPVSAQAFDPRPILNNLIFAFQNCGPPQNYQVLSPWLTQTIAQQTGGTGCYSFMAGAGQVTGMQVTSTKEFPIGPLYSIRVFHVAGPVDWLIGFNRITGKVEYLNYQAAIGANPVTVENRMPNGRIINEPELTPDPDDRPDDEDNELSEQCKKFPVMCPKE